MCSLCSFVINSSMKTLTNFNEDTSEKVWLSMTGRGDRKQENVLTDGNTQQAGMFFPPPLAHILPSSCSCQATKIQTQTSDSSPGKISCSLQTRLPGASVIVLFPCRGCRRISMEMEMNHCKLCPYFARTAAEEPEDAVILYAQYL